jgi:hypothetical protein
VTGSADALPIGSPGRLVLAVAAVGTVAVSRPTLSVEVRQRPFLVAARADLPARAEPFGRLVLDATEEGVDRAEQ